MIIIRDRDPKAILYFIYFHIINHECVSHYELITLPDHLNIPRTLLSPAVPGNTTAYGDDEGTGEPEEHAEDFHPVG